MVTFSLKDKPAQVIVARQFAELTVDVARVDDEPASGFGRAQVGGAERHLLKESFHYRMQTARTDVLGPLVYLPGHLGDTADAVRSEFELDVLGPEQRLVLLGQRRARFREYALEIIGSQGAEL